MSNQAQVVVSAGDDDKPIREGQGSDEDAIHVLSEAILSAEENLHRSVVHDGPSSPQTRVIATDLVLKYNHLGVRLLSENDIKGSLFLLQKAQLLTSQKRPYLGNARLQARAVTLNNLGCLMKKWGKPRVGITYLARALRIEAKAPGGTDNPAGTHANMSAALSTLGMHRAAAVYAVHAVGLASKAVEKASAATSAVDAPTDSGGGADREASVELSAANNSGGGGRSGCGEGNDIAGHAVAGCAAAAAAAAAADDDDDDDNDGLGGGGGIGGGGGGGGSGSNSVQHDGHVDSAAERDGKKGQEEVAPLASTDESDSGVITVRREDSKEALLLDANHGEGMGSQGGRTEDDSTASVATSHHDKEPKAGGLLAIAYFNLAVEREHLGQPEAALEAYEKARATAALHLDAESPVAKAIELALETASDSTLSAFCTPRAVVQSSCLSFPSIGKLYFGPRTQGETLRGSRLSRRWLSPSRQWSQKGEEEEADVGDNTRLSARQSARLSARHDARESSGQSLLERAYTSQQPSPPSHRGRRARMSQLSRNSPPFVVGPGPPGPQRAGRWARDAQESVPPQKTKTRTCTSSGGGGGVHGVGGKIQPSDKRRGKQEDGIMWRARVCAERGCSPDDARRAQLSGRNADGCTAKDGSPKIAFSR